MAVDALKVPMIDKLAVKSTKREVKDEGDVVDVEVVTTVSFEAVNLKSADIGRLTSMIRDERIDVFFGSPQAIMELVEEPEAAVAVG